MKKTTKTVLQGLVMGAGAALGAVAGVLIVSPLNKAAEKVLDNQNATVKDTEDKDRD